MPEKGYSGAIIGLSVRIILFRSKNKKDIEEICLQVDIHIR